VWRVRDMPQSWLGVGGGLDFSYGGRSGAYDWGSGWNQPVWIRWE
jgi:hypothetical protein